MNAAHRLLLTLAAALLAAGIGGVAAHGHSSPRVAKVTTTTGARVPPTTRSATRPSHPTAPPTPGRPGPSSATLAGGLITPTDTGGYFGIDPQAASSILDSTPCLAGLQPSPAQSGRAFTGLVDRIDAGLPTLLETAVSYPGSSAAAVYRALVTATGSVACTTFHFAYDGSGQAVPIRPADLPPVGDAVSAWSGRFAAAGVALQLQMAYVLDGQTVIHLLYIDSLPPANPILGDFQSDVSLAIGKLA